MVCDEGEEQLARGRARQGWCGGYVIVGQGARAVEYVGGQEVAAAALVVSRGAASGGGCLGWPAGAGPEVMRLRDRGTTTRDS